MIRNLLLRKLLCAWGAGTWFVPSPLQRVTTDTSGALALTLLDSHLKRNLLFGPDGGHGGL